MIVSSYQWVMKHTMRRHKNNKKKHIIVIASIVALAAISVGVWWLMPRTLTTTTGSSSSTGSTSAKDSSASTTNSTGPTSEANTSSETTSIDSSVTPIAPSGTFVSNHRPKLSASNQGSLESTCSTTPGATCQIEFSQSGTVKTLPAKTVDSSGNTSWTWSLQDVGITAGEWSVRAIATNGSRTSSSQDALSMVVSE